MKPYEKLADLMHYQISVHKYWSIPLNLKFYECVTIRMTPFILRRAA